MFFVVRPRSLSVVRGGLVHRALHWSPRLAVVKHSSDTYAKDDVDATPPPPGSHVYRIDTTRDTAQKPNEPVPNLASRDSYADVQRPENSGKPREYRTIDSSYATEGGQHALRYGGKEELARDKGPETSTGDEGPEKKSKGGRS